MFTFKILIFRLLSESVNVNVAKLKTFPFSLISIIIYIYFYSIINVHMFTRYAKGLFLLACDMLPLKKVNVHTHVHMFTLKKINYGF